MLPALGSILNGGAAFLSEFWPYAAFLVAFAFVSRFVSIRLSSRDGESMRASGVGRSGSFSGTSWGDKAGGALKEYRNAQRRDSRSLEAEYYRSVARDERRKGKEGGGNGDTSESDG